MPLLRATYTLIAPWYDVMVASATRPHRARSLQRLPEGPGARVLLSGVGSGLDLPLMLRHPVTGIDLTPAMLRRARRRSRSLGRCDAFVVGDVRSLPFPDGCFDAVVMHLILAVIPRPAEAIAEAARVLAPGGRVLVWDKFLRPGQAAPLLRLASRVVGPFLTRTDVVFEELLAAAPSLAVTADRPSLLGGWFRFITLERRQP